MVAELFAVSQALEKFAIVPGAVHPWVKPLSKGSFLLTDLDGTGTVRALRLGQPEEAAHVPKVQKDNQNGFPTFKLVYPLFDLAADAALRAQLKDKGLTAARRAQLLRSGVGIAPRAEVDKNRKRLSQMAKFACELRGFLTGRLDECPAVGRLMEIIKIIDAAVFEDSLVQALLWAIDRGEDSKTLQAVLIGEINKRGQVDGGEIPVVLDIYREPGDEIPRLARDQTGRFYSAALLGQQSGKVDGVCALTGYEAELSATSPSPRLPGLADTILFSANPDIPCVTRYGLIGTSAFPIGKSTAQRLNDTALWMTGADRERKTWSQVPRGEGSGRDLVLAYVDLDPALDAPMAELLSSVDATQAEGIFEAKAERVQDALADFRGKLKTGGMLRVLVLRRISKGQVQVELSRMYDVGRLPGCLKDWKAAASNVPMISMARPVAKGQPPEPIPFRIPYPGEVVEATKWLWIRGGDEKQAVTGLPLGRVYDLFLGEALGGEGSSFIIDWSNGTQHVGTVVVDGGSTGAIRAKCAGCARSRAPPGHDGGDRSGIGAIQAREKEGDVYE